MHPRFSHLDYGVADHIESERQIRLLFCFEALAFELLRLAWFELALISLGTG